jgi:hypothetical protein
MSRDSQARKAVMVELTRGEILALNQHDIVLDSYGDRWKITRKKTWITRPDNREFGMKRGLYQFTTISVSDGLPNWPLYKMPNGKAPYFDVNPKLVGW